jgi:hypothetical protein
MYICIYTHIYIFIYVNIYTNSGDYNDNQERENCLEYITEENECDMNNDDYSGIGNDMCLHIYMCICMYICMKICVFIKNYIYTNMYIYTCI